MGWAAAAGALRGGPEVRAAPVLKRLATAVVAIPAFVWVVAAAPPWTFAALVVLAAAAAFLELSVMLERAGRPVHRRLGLAAGAVLTASFATGAPGVVVGALAAAVGALLSALLWARGGPETEAAANTLLGVLYAAWLPGFAILLHGLPGGAVLVLFLVGVTWAGESAAYLVGSVVGRHPLAPVLSPRKTVEGAAAQGLVSVGAAGALGAWLLPGCGAATLLGAGALLGVVGQIGDLVESAVKRSAGTKDAGVLLPGHGGVLDRLDSLLFNVPAFYYYWMALGCTA